MFVISLRHRKDNTNFRISQTNNTKIRIKKDLIFLFAFSLAHVVLELGVHGLRLVEEGADVGLDGHSFLPAAHGAEWVGCGKLCGSVWVCRTFEYGMGYVDEGVTGFSITISFEGTVSDWRSRS